MLVAFLYPEAKGQNMDRKKNINLQVNFIPEIPLGSVSNRFGYNQQFSIQLEYLQQYKWSYFLTGAVRLGDKVKQDVLAPLRNNEGYISGVNGYYADIFGRKRGYEYGIGGSYLQEIGKHHLRFETSVIQLGHWIRIVDDSRSVPQVTNEYAKLYDQFTSGFGIRESFLYQLNINEDRSSIIIGVQSSQAFTRNHRALGNSRSWDIYLGLRVGYLLPLFRFDDGETIYY